MADRGCGAVARLVGLAWVAAWVAVWATQALAADKDGLPAGDRLVVGPSALSDKRLHLAWRAAAAEGSGAAYRYRAAGSDAWTTVSAGSTTAATISGLAPGTTYEVQVGSDGSAANGDWSSVATGRTLQGPGLGNLRYATSEVGQASSRVNARSGIPGTSGRFGTNVGTMVNGCFLTVFAPNGGSGPGGFLLYDLSNPRQLRLVRRIYEPEGRTAEIREAHSLGVARVDGSTYVAVQSARGIEFWDFTDIDDITQISRLQLPGVIGGDYFGTAWQLWWQAPYVYVAGSSRGLFVVDASDPARPFLARLHDRPNPIPPGEDGGFKVGPVFAMGNHLVLASMHSREGWASLDLSDPAEPMLLARTPELSLYYSACFDGKRMFSATRGSGEMVEYDLSDPAVFRRASAIPTGNSLYCAIQDDRLFQGGPRLFATYDIGGPAPRHLADFRISRDNNLEHGHVLPFGNLVYVGDDHGIGSAFVPHSAEPDANGPAVVAVSPRAGATRQALTTRIGIGFSECDPVRIGDGRHLAAARRRGDGGRPDV